MEAAWRLEEADVHGARCLRALSAVIDVSVTRGDLFPDGLQMACLGIPACYSVVPHILTVCEVPAWCFRDSRTSPWSNGECKKFM